MKWIRDFGPLVAELSTDIIELSGPLQVFVKDRAKDFDLEVDGRSRPGEWGAIEDHAFEIRQLQQRLQGQSDTYKDLASRVSCDRMVEAVLMLIQGASLETQQSARPAR